MVPFKIQKKIYFIKFDEYGKWNSSWNLRKLQKKLSLRKWYSLFSYIEHQNEEFRKNNVVYIYPDKTGKWSKYDWKFINKNEINKKQNILYIG